MYVNYPIPRNQHCVLSLEYHMSISVESTMGGHMSERAVHPSEDYAVAMVSHLSSLPHFLLFLITQRLNPQPDIDHRPVLIVCLWLETLCN